MKFRRALLMLPVIVSPVIIGLPAQAQVPCMNEIQPLRTEVEKAAESVQAAINRKAERSEVCNGLKRFAAAEARFMKYLETNQSWCAIPPEAIKQIKTTHGHTLKMRGQACAAGPIGGARQAPPPGPGLSEALGTARTPTVTNEKTDRGTYNTLTGNPLQR